MEQIIQRYTGRSSSPMMFVQATSCRQRHTILLIVGVFEGRVSLSEVNIQPLFLVNIDAGVPDLQRTPLTRPNQSVQPLPGPHPRRLGLATSAQNGAASHCLPAKERECAQHPRVAMNHSQSDKGQHSANASLRMAHLTGPFPSPPNFAA